jgi:hypothetical protein
MRLSTRWKARLEIINFDVRCKLSTDGMEVSRILRLLGIRTYGDDSLAYNIGHSGVPVVMMFGTGIHLILAIFRMEGHGKQIAPAELRMV